jgi:hypothetical protein
MLAVILYNVSEGDTVSMLIQLELVDITGTSNEIKNELECEPSCGKPCPKTGVIALTQMSWMFL